MIKFGVDIPNCLECFSGSMFVENIEYGERTTKAGLIINSETMDARGEFVRPRWAKVKYKADNIKSFNVGDYILLSHGCWCRGMKLIIQGNEQTIWYIPKKSVKEGVMAVSKTMPKHLEEYGFGC